MVPDPSRFHIFNELLAEQCAQLAHPIPPANPLRRRINKYGEILPVRQAPVREKIHKFLCGIHLEYLLQGTSRGGLPRNHLIKPPWNNLLLVVKEESDVPRTRAIILVELIIPQAPVTIHAVPGPRNVSDT